MRRAIACCALSVALLAGVPAVALADDAGQDTQTDVVEVAVEGDETIDESSPATEPESSSADTKGAPSSTVSAQKAPSTGDQLMGIVIPCVVATAAALAALGVAAVRQRAKKRE